MSEKKDLAASVHARLLNRARKEGRTFNELLQYYAMERFLFRLSRSPHASRFVLKGALMLQYWSGTSSRPTRDIDLLSSESQTIDALVEIVRDCVLMSVPADGIRFEPDSVSGGAIRARAKYAGIRVQLLGYLGNARTHLQVDVGFGDVVTPAAVEIEYPTLLDFDSPRLLAYTPETTIAEKVEAMASLGTANTRFKDFYDIWKLSTRCSFDRVILGEAIARTFERRGTELPTEPLDTFGEAFSQQPEKPTQWNVFLRKARLDDCPRELSDLLREIARFVQPVLESLRDSSRESMAWSPEDGWCSPPAE